MLLQYELLLLQRDLMLHVCHVHQRLRALHAIKHPGNFFLPECIPETASNAFLLCIRLELAGKSYKIFNNSS